MKKIMQQKPFLFLLLQLSLTLSSFISAASSPPPPPSDTLALLAFKSKADLTDTLHFPTKTTFHFCTQWQGVTCSSGGKVVRLVLQHLRLLGTFPPDSLTRLDQLRVLSLQNNSLTGPIPDLSQLINLKSLFLDHNSFVGHFPPTISALRRIRTVDLSYNNLTGIMPAGLATLDRLYYLRVEHNFFIGSIPVFNQSSLQIFNVSSNNFSGPIPITPTLLHFVPSSFSDNLHLCGEIIHKVCHSGAGNATGPPFFNPSSGASASASPPSTNLSQIEQLRNEDKPVSSNHSNRTSVIIGFSCGVAVLISSVICLTVAVKRAQKNRGKGKLLMGEIAADSSANENAAVLMRIEEDNELEEKVRKKVQGMRVGKSGSLVFCAGEAQVYTMDQLMTASAEMLGRGTVGTTYKAVLVNRLIVTVKRLDAGKIAGTPSEVFQQHMESVGGLRHPNLVPLRSYFQANEERLLVYDYQPNGSLFNLIHGKPGLSELTQLGNFVE